MTTVSLPVYGRKPSEVNIINKDYGFKLTEVSNQKSFAWMSYVTFPNSYIRSVVSLLLDKRHL